MDRAMQECEFLFKLYHHLEPAEAAQVPAVDHLGKEVFFLLAQAPARRNADVRKHSRAYRLSTPESD
jgi:hypothetical protein